LRQLKTSFQSIHYWSSKSYVAEIDFVIEDEDNVIPIEVKTATNPKAKSLAQYRKNTTRIFQ